MDIERTELLEGEPLPPSKPMKPRLLWGLVAVALLTALGLLGGPYTQTLGFLALALWIVYAGSLYVRSRAFLQARGTVLRVRNMTRMHDVDAADVKSCSYQFNGRKPDFELRLKNGKRVWIPASKLEGGHATLLAWLTWFTPEGTLDEKSTRYRDSLVRDGAI